TAARAYQVIGSMQVFTDPASAVATYERGAELAREAADDVALGANLVDLGIAFMYQAREAPAVAALEAAYPVNARTELRICLCYHWWVMSFFAAAGGGP